MMPAKMNTAWLSSEVRELVVDIPMRLDNPLNGSQGRHWAPKARRRKQQRTTVALVVRAMLMAEGIKLPVHVTVTRIAPRKLDAWDGLGAACKGVIDGIADALGCRDDDARVAWATDQRKGAPRQYAVEIRIRQGE